ncbi:hypothetical protein BGZ99_003773 [Dissophora globulifera]|uniref:RNI-like protein n=1 Tax=Dissophora globulifera TaxID=979702 RepID=A0A9P6RNF0_9FUNG|nr:hypothetical protein BGZ99_003773 [Dissophora globulifera]
MLSPMARNKRHKPVVSGPYPASDGETTSTSIAAAAAATAALAETETATAGKVTTAVVTAAATGQITPSVDLTLAHDHSLDLEITGTTTITTPTTPSAALFLVHRATNPLNLHEIRINVARSLARQELWSCSLVNEAWWESFFPFLWRDLRPVYRNVLGPGHDYPSARQLRKNGHFIRTFEYNGHTSVLQAMIPDGNDQGYSNTEATFACMMTEDDLQDEDAWLYADEDAESSSSSSSSTSSPLKNVKDETLSEFEDRLERRRVGRREQMARMQDVKIANQRQNAVSKFLNDTTDYSRQPCSNRIERLILTDRRLQRDRNYHFKNFVRLMRSNQQHLRACELMTAVWPPDLFDQMFSVVLAGQVLTELVLANIELDRQKVRPFLEVVCVRLVKLGLKNMRIEYGEFLGQMGEGQGGASSTTHQIMKMERMKSLTLHMVKARTSIFPIEFVKQCPNLVELEFQSHWEFDMKVFPAILAEKVPGITHLTIRETRMMDILAASIIKSAVKLEKLDLTGSEFGLMATNHLSTRHPCTITSLDVRGCPQLTGAMIQRILGECRNLKFFAADYIRAKDMVSNSVYLTWACVGLRELILDFRGDPRDTVTNLKIYKQLGMLTCLEHLDISHNPGSASIPNSSLAPDAIPERVNCLTLGLRDGLGELRALVHMKKLVYRGILNNEVGLAELRWMAKAWPLLGLIGGRLRQRKSTRYNPNVHPEKEEEPQEQHDNSNSSSNNNSNHNPNSDISSSSSSSLPLASLSSSAAASTSLQGTRNDGSSAIPLNPNVYPVKARVGAPATTSTTKTPTRMAASNRNRPEAPPNLMALELRRLKLDRRIKVIRHREDRITPEQRRRYKYNHMLWGSSDDDEDRLGMRPRDTVSRYLGDWI